MLLAKPSYQCFQAFLVSITHRREFQSSTRRPFLGQLVEQV